MGAVDLDVDVDVDVDLDLEGGAADGRKFAECSFYKDCHVMSQTIQSESVKSGVK